MAAFTLFCAVGVVLTLVLWGGGSWAPIERAIIHFNDSLNEGLGALLGAMVGFSAVALASWLGFVQLRKGQDRQAELDRMARAEQAKLDREAQDRQVEIARAQEDERRTQMRIDLASSLA